MIGSPETQYVRTPRGAIAYQVTGSGPLTVAFVQGTSSSSVAWEEPWSARSLQRLSAFCRLVTFDARGEGRSDPLPFHREVTLEERVDDLVAVLEAAGAGQTALLGTHDGGPVCLVLAAQEPRRISALALYNTWARLAKADDHSFGIDPDLLAAGGRVWADLWGTGGTLDLLAPSVASDPAMRRAWARHEQSSASPSQAAAGTRLAMALDVRHILGLIRVPTLVLHTTENHVVSVEHGRHLAAAVPGARYLELRGADHVLMIGECDQLLFEVEQFLTGAPPVGSIDRVLGTMLFTDIVGSTLRLSEVGDREWHRILDRHHDLIRSELARHRGREVTHTGDGVFAIFDGPARAVECARMIARGAREMGLTVRAGLHTGECEVAGDSVSGIAVHIAARVADLAAPDEVWVTRTVKDLVAGSGLVFEPRGTPKLKGVDEQWDVFTAVDQIPAASVT